MRCIQGKEPVHNGILFVFLFNFALIPSVLSENNVRLVGGKTSTEGQVEIFHNGQWGKICGEGWDIRDAQVACRMLGLPGAKNAVLDGRFGKRNGKLIWLFNVACVGTERSLSDCQHSGWGVYSYCYHYEYAGVVCRTALGDKENDVRLVGGKTSTEGRVEIFHNGQWGKICGDRWDIRDAHVACRMLDLPGAKNAVLDGRFGAGTGKPIWFDNVECFGTEQSLTECPHSRWGLHNNCYHKEDAGVVCRAALNNKAVTVQFEEKYRKVVTEPDTEKEKLVKLMCRMDGVSNTSVVVNFTVDPLSTVAGNISDIVLINKSLTFPANVSPSRLPIYVGILKDDYVDSSEVFQIEIKKAHPNDSNFQIGGNFIAYFTIYDHSEFYFNPGQGNSNRSTWSVGTTVLVSILLFFFCACCCGFCVGCCSKLASEGTSSNREQGEGDHTNRAFFMIIKVTKHQ